MNQLLEDLLKVMTLERLELNLFRGESRDIGSPQVFGGQVLGQALVAATATVEERVVHSLHAYFLRRGDFNAPIVYEVDRARDGNHFSTRRVVAIQHGAADLQHVRVVPSRRDRARPSGRRCPRCRRPRSWPISNPTIANPAGRVAAGHAPDARRKRPFEFRPVQPPNFLQAAKAAAAQAHLVSRRRRAAGRRGAAPVPARLRLGFPSARHGDAAARSVARDAASSSMASIDHAMWFHRSVRVDDWLLYATDSPSASGARGFTRGSIFARDGRLVASTAQEGLMRVIRVGADTRS